jgi:hypothetical protein
MRKFILVTALVLASASAQAGPRSLTVAANDEPAAVETSKAPVAKAVDDKAVSSDSKSSDIKASDTSAPDAPKFVERPAVVDTNADQPKADTGKPVSDRKVEKPRRRHESTEARVIYELHRHGIYW